MIVLAVESSARACSVALAEDDKLICEIFSDSGLTHSRTLMKMINDTFSLTGLDFSLVDALAVSLGPGSFTGIRIGISCVKGLCQPRNLSCFGFSTLEAMAYGALGHSNCTICSVMDARCGQVYAGLFGVKGTKIERLSTDMALSMEELCALIKEQHSQRPVYLIGDGAKLFYDNLDTEINSKAVLAPSYLRMQRASSLVFAAFLNQEKTENLLSYDKLVPIYLRPSQAERNLKKEK